jgi:hypothetical protein
MESESNHSCIMTRNLLCQNFNSTLCIYRTFPLWHCCRWLDGIKAHIDETGSPTTQSFKLAFLSLPLQLNKDRYVDPVNIVQTLGLPVTLTSTHHVPYRRTTRRNGTLGMDAANERPNSTKSDHRARERPWSGASVVSSGLVGASQCWQPVMRSVKLWWRHVRLILHAVYHLCHAHWPFYPDHGYSGALNL